MSRIALVAGNTAYLLLAQIILSISTLLLSIAIARSLGDVGFGDYSFAITFVSLFAIISDLGYDIILTREVSKDPTRADEYVSNITGLRMVLSVGVFSFIVIAINLLGYPDHIKTIVYIFGLYILIVSISAVFKAAFRAFEIMKYESAVIIIGGMIRLSLGLLVLALGYGLYALAIVFLISGLAELTFSSLMCKIKVVRPRVCFNLSFMRGTMSTAISIAFFTAMMAILVRTDTLLLSLIKGQQVVGWYNAAYNLVLAMAFIPTLLQTSLFPTAMRASMESKDLFKVYYQKAVRYMLAVAIPLALGLTMLAMPIVYLIYGQEFQNSIPALQVLAWDCCLFFVSGVLAHALIGVGKERGVGYSTFICILINIGLNILLIPMLGFLAAALTTLISELILIAFYVYIFKRAVGPMPMHRFLAKPFLACIPMGIALLFLADNIFLAIPAGIVIYFATFYFIGGFEISELEFINSTIHNLVRTIKRT